MLSLMLAFVVHATTPVGLAGPKGAPAPPPAAAMSGEPPYGAPEGRRVVKREQVCFRDPVLGSKIPTRRCMDREAFEQRQQEAKDHLDAIQRDARSPTGG